MYNIGCETNNRISILEAQDTGPNEPQSIDSSPPDDA